MNVLIVDDHPMVLEYLTAAVGKALPHALVRTSGTLTGALEVAREHRLDLVLLDLGVPGCGGIDSVLRFRRDCPEATVLVVSSNDDRDSITGALAVGAAGFVPKSAGPKVLLQALRMVADGGRYIPPELEAASAAGKAQAAGRRAGESALTERQRAVLACMLQGLNNAQIADALGIAEATVKQHAHAVYQAFGVSSRVDLILSANRSRTGTA